MNFARAMCLGANVLAGPDQRPFGNGTIKYDAIIWLDSDMVFDSRTVDKHTRMFISCIFRYTMDGGHQLCCVENWDEEYYKEHGTFEFLSVEEGSAHCQYATLCKGIMLIWFLVTIRSY